MSKLIFSPDGNILLHWFKATKSSWSITDSPIPSFETLVDVWNIAKGKFLYSTSGFLIGMSDNGKTFLTQCAENNFTVIETANGNRFSLEKGLASSEDYSTLHHRFYLGENISVCDVFKEYPSQKISIPDRITDMELGPYLFAAFWFDMGDGIEGAYGQAISLLTGEVSYTFSVNRHAVSVPIHYSTIHNVLFIDQDFTAYNLTTGEELDDDNKIVAAVQETVRKVGRKINGVGFHPNRKYMALSLSKGVIEIWDMSKNQYLKTLAKPN